MQDNSSAHPLTRLAAVSFRLAGCAECDVLLGKHPSPQMTFFNSLAFDNAEITRHVWDLFGFVCFDFTRHVAATTGFTDLRRFRQGVRTGELS